jgi:hypothetical protein
MPNLIIIVRILSAPVPETQHTLAIPVASLTADRHVEILLDVNGEILQLQEGGIDDTIGEHMQVDLVQDVEHDIGDIMQVDGENMDHDIEEKMQVDREGNF